MVTSCITCNASRAFRRASIDMNHQSIGVQLQCAPCSRVLQRPFTSFSQTRKRVATLCKAGTGPEQDDVSRRGALQAAVSAAAALSFGNGFVTSGPAQAAAKEFAPVKDPQDGYSFVYPFGWQEVAVKGQDVVYKDVIEPLESVSVSITQTDKADVTEFGSPAEVALTLAEKVLSPPKQEVKVLNFDQKEKDGRIYYTFEFASKASNYIRHALAIVTVGNGKFYTLATGANERRWNKVKPRLEQVVQSFEVQNRYDAAPIG